MKKKAWILGSLMALTMVVGTSRASELPELTQHLTEMLETTGAAVQSCASESSSSFSENGEQWYYRRFWLRFRPRVSFAIPGFAKLEIVPELEMLWQRDLPTGWEAYKPFR